MYYYILEQPKSITISRIYNRIKNNLDLLGIVGEMVKVSPARSVDELVEIALAKEYSTIVAVGSDLLVNKVVSNIYGKDCVLGVIPIDASPLMHQIIGTDDLVTACESLKLRRIKLVNLAVVNPGKFFLTEIKITSSKSINVNVKIDDYSTQVESTDLVIRNGLDGIDGMSIDGRLSLFLENKNIQPNILLKTFNWLIGKKETNIYKSVLRGQRIILETGEHLPVNLAEEIVAKTPIIVESRPKVLKIITTRARMKQEVK